MEYALEKGANGPIDAAMTGRYLTFTVSGETYGIEIRCVAQIVGIQTITEMPEMPFYMKGVVNLRGKIIPVIDMRLRFGKPAKEYDDRTCIIIIDIDGTGRSFGLITDSVSEVSSIAGEDIEPPPGGGAAQGYIRGIGKTASKAVFLIDCAKLLSEDGAGGLDRR